MQIQIQLSEPYWRAAGKRNLELDIEEGARLADVLDALRRGWPALSHDLDEASPVCFVEEIQAQTDTILSDGCQLHLVWPVAGG